jgi:hypothetical protein
MPRTTTYQQPNGIDHPHYQKRVRSENDTAVRTRKTLTHVGYADRNSAREAAMHKLHTPAVIRPVGEEKIK